jgi:putative lipoic acid-binding regulatory protein
MEPEKIEPEKITFPCDYPVKVVARASEDLRERLDNVFAAHFGTFDAARVTVRESAQANFVSFTYTMVVESVEQLKTLHVALQESAGVVMVI